MTGQETTDIMILGPAMSSGDKVIDAIHALYFLPENFKLILTGSTSADQSFFKKIDGAIDRLAVRHRIIFDGDIEEVHAIVLPNAGKSRAANAVAGDSPEAIASAILGIVRDN